MTQPLPRRPFFGGLLDEDGVVEQVWPGSPAARGDVRIGDRVQTIDGARVVVSRDGQDVALTIAVEPRPVESIDGADVELGEIATEGIRQRTFIARPRGATRPPIVVMLMGLSAASVDGFPPRADPLLELVAELASVGIATLRLEKRGVGDSEGGPAHEVDFAAERTAAAAAIAAAAELPGIDRTRVVVFGHSMGGMIAPLVASPHARGIVAYGTWASRFVDGMLASMQRQRPHADPVELERDGLRLRAIVEHGEGEALLYGRTPRYFRQLQQIDLHGAWREIAVPCLLLHGAQDRITSLDDHRAIADSVGAHAEVRELAGLDHDMTGDTGAIARAIAHFVAAL